MKSSAVVKLVPVLIVAMMAVSGWYVYQTNKISDQTNEQLVNLSESVQAKIESVVYKDTAGNYALNYPKNWTVTSEFGGGEGAVPDPAVTSRPANFIPTNAPNNNSVSVLFMNDSNTLQSFEQSMKANNHTVKTIKINGYPTAYSNYTFKDTTEGYTEHVYVITSGNKAIRVSFRSKYNHYNVNPPVMWDDGKDLGGYLSIVKSIKFL